MSESIPAIQSAYLNIQQAIANAKFALLEWEEDDPNWDDAQEFLTWAIVDLEAAKAKVQNEAKHQ